MMDITDKEEDCKQNVHKNWREREYFKVRFRIPVAFPVWCIPSAGMNGLNRKRLNRNNLQTQKPRNANKHRDAFLVSVIDKSVVVKIKKSKSMW